MKSMTSYAYLDGTVNGTDISCELKSYNSRYLDLNINIPSTMTQLEPFLRKYFSKQIIRGKVDFYLRLKKVHSEQPILPNIPLAQAYYKSIADIARALGMESQITLDLILRQEGVLQIDKDFDEELWQKALVPILDELIRKFNSCRIEEGKALYADIRKMLSVLSDSVTEIERHAAKMEELFFCNAEKEIFRTYGT
ncbi:YicC-like protein [Treponema vincentii ATCC 35580]|uniref:YicC-like protein n=1 Tax=Treponema vincentii ATCC 35580 TaxID=596324 RepID=C8PQC9_9SPIR|nr:YicC/YloC family endoribonuclease [Treponema vincentii]EEV20284.1 YicC-like protein [Treponema vincentii ATCC 35580]